MSNNSDNAAIAAKLEAMDKKLDAILARLNEAKKNETDNLTGGFFIGCLSCRDTGGSGRDDLTKVMQ